MCTFTLSLASKVPIFSSCGNNELDSNGQLAESECELQVAPAHLQIYTQENKKQFSLSLSPPLSVCAY